MASTYSTLKIELIGTGEQAGLWGTTTNTNLGTALEEAIVGSADVSFSSADVTLTLTDTNASQSARHVRLNLTGTSGGARNLILGSGCQIDKPYLINNGLADTVTVKNTTGTGIAVPAGKTMWVFNNGTNVVDAVTHLSSLTLGSALPVASGGTGITAFGTGVATALGQNVSGSGSIALTTSPVFTTPNLGTPSAVTLTSATGLPLSTGVTGQLPLANGGTGANLVDPNADRILFWDDSAGAMTFLTVSTGLSISGTTLTATGSGGTVTSVSGTGTVNGITLTGTVTSSGSLTLGGTLSNVSLSTQVTGTLPVANGGSGQTTAQAAMNTFAGAVTSGSYLRGNGTNVVMSTIQAGDVPTLNQNTTGSAATLTTSRTIQTNLASTSAASFNGSANITPGVTGTLPVANGGTGVTSSTGSGSVVLSTSPSLTTPVLGTPTSGNLSNCTVDGTNSVGFINIPQVSQSAAYTLVATDSGKHILHPSADTTARTFTIPANSSVPFAIGTAITFVNQNGAGVVTIAITTDTMRLAGAGTTGSRTLAANGVATAIKLTSTEWIISGVGLT